MNSSLLNIKVIQLFGSRNFQRRLDFSLEVLYNKNVRKDMEPATFEKQGRGCIEKGRMNEEI